MSPLPPGHGDEDDAPPGPPALSIGQAARRLMRVRGYSTTLTLAEVLSAWPEITGPEVAAHARPKAVHAGTLTIEVDEPAWATQLQFLSGDIVRALFDRLGEGAPTAVDVVVARGRPGRRQTPGSA